MAVLAVLSTGPGAGDPPGPAASTASTVIGGYLGSRSSR